MLVYYSLLYYYSQMFMEISTIKGVNDEMDKTKSTWDLNLSHYLMKNSSQLVRHQTQP